MKVLFIGGTGIISSACAEVALQRGVELWLLTRGKSFRPVPAGAQLVVGDIRQPDSVRQALANQTFDVVVEWLAFTPAHIQTDLDLFTGRTGQYIFISSASVYQTPPRHLPVSESTPLFNPYWEYSQQKIACEERLVQAYRDENFPSTIVRPSHTYDRTLFPFHGGYTVLDRMLNGKPVIVHGDGTSLWTLTHHQDFARGFAGLLGNPHTIGEAIHITSDESLTWDQIYQMIAAAAGVEAQLVHVPSELIAAYDPDWGDSLLGDKTHSMIFDNTKIKNLVPDFKTSIPFFRGAQEIVAWYLADPTRQKTDRNFNGLLDEILNGYKRAFPAPG